MKSLLALAFLVPSLAAQLPPPTYQIEHVGVYLRSQVSPDIRQRVSVFCEPGNAVPGSPGLGQAVMAGTRVWGFSSSVDMYGNYLPRNEVMTFFTLTFMDGGMTTIPWASAGHNVIFSNPSIFIMPTHIKSSWIDGPWDRNGYGAFNVTTAGWSPSFLGLDIPPGLPHSYISIQSYRIPLETGVNYPGFYASDEIVLEIL